MTVIRECVPTVLDGKLGALVFISYSYRDEIDKDQPRSLFAIAAIAMAETTA